jgi:hypothetical protein
LGINPKFPACKNTLEMEGVLTPGFKMDETAGILPVQEKGVPGSIPGGGGGGGARGAGNQFLDGEDVVRSESEPDFALHTPPAPEWEGGGDFAGGYEDGDPMDDGEIEKGELDGGYEDADPAEEFEEEAKARDYDGSGSGDEFV